MSRSLVLRLGVLILACALMPPGVEAQQPRKVWRIGFLANTPSHTSPESTRIWDAFREELRDRGYIEGRNITFERRFAEGKIERYPAFAAELVQLGVDVLVAASVPPALAAKKATATIPIVMVSVADPIENGLVASLARPGGNITGVTDDALNLIPKRLEFLKAIVPGASRVAFIRCLKCAALDPPAREAARKASWAATAKDLGITLVEVDLSAPEELDNAAAAALSARPDAIFLAPNALNFRLRGELSDFALRHRLALFSGYRENAIAGSLMSYGASLPDLFRKAAVFVDKILKGAHPKELPVEDPTKLELVINLKTARALGITIPGSILVSATELIE